MQKFLNLRGVRDLYHFTRIENIENIVEKGLLPVEVIDFEVFKTDPCRYDKCKDANCLSISFPNYLLLYRMMKQNGRNNYVVLEIDAEIIYHCKCAFCKTNAGNGLVFNTTVESREGENAFLSLFEDEVFEESRSERLPNNYPTNPQAEVLIFSVIPLEYIKRAIFYDIEVMNDYKTILESNGIDVVVDRFYFGKR